VGGPDTLAAHRGKKWAGRGPPGPIASAAYGPLQIVTRPAVTFPFADNHDPFDHSLVTEVLLSIIVIRCYAQWMQHIIHVEI